MSANPPDDKTWVEESSLWRRLMDKLYGRDFFISYRWEDGRDYAVLLGQRLKAERFDCFLDSEEFLKGDNWQRVGDRELRKTRRLVLVGSPGVHKSAAVVRELRAFGQKQGAVIPIEFGDSLSLQLFPDSEVLKALDPHAIRQREAAEALLHPPRDEVVAMLRKRFAGESATSRRLKFIQGIASVLLVLFLLAAAAAVVAWVQYDRNLKGSALTEAQRAASEMEAGNLDGAVAHLVRAVQLNPDDPSAVAALARLAVEKPPVESLQLGQENVSAVAMSSNGETVLLRDPSGNVAVWRATTGAAQMETRARQVTHMAVSPGGQWVVVASGRGLGVVRSPGADGSSPLWHDISGLPTALVISDEGVVVWGGDKGQVGILKPGDAQGGKLLQPPLTTAVSKLALMDAPHMCAGLDHAGVWQVWDTNGNKQGGEEQTRIGEGEKMVFARSGSAFASSFDAGELGESLPRSAVLAFTRAEGGAESGWVEQGLSPEFPRVRIVDLSCDQAGRTCVARLDTNEVILAGRLLDRQESLSRNGALAVTISGDGSVVTTVHTDGTLRRWEGEHLAPLGTVTHAPPGAVEMVSSEDGSVVILRTARSTLRYTFPASQGRANPSITPSVAVAKIPSTFLPLAPAGRRLSSIDGRVTVARAVDSAEDSGEWQVTRGNKVIPISHGMTSAEVAKWDSLWEGSHFSIHSRTAAALSGKGCRMVTCAAAQPLRVWDTSTGRRVASIPTAGRGYPGLIALSDDGRRLLVSFIDPSGNRRSYQVYDTSNGEPSGPVVPLYSGESLWDTTPALDKVLVEVGDSLEVRETQSGRRLVEPVSLGYVVWNASFAAGGRSFLLATRDGRFRLWRTADALPLCGVSTFDTDAPNYSGAPGDTYQFSVWVESAPARPDVLRRLAFKVVGGTPPWSIFDMGLVGNRSQHRRLAELVAKSYGVRLDGEGNLRHETPASNSALRGEYLSPSSWEFSDFRSIAEWLLEGRQAQFASPFTATEKGK